MESPNPVKRVSPIESTNGEQPPNPIQWSPPRETHSAGASGEVNRVDSSRAGCPREGFLTDVCGVVQPSKVPPGQAPWYHGTKGNQKFQCCLCERTFSRCHTVKAHFVVCVNRNGNPEGKSWNEHPSVANYKPRRVISEYQLDRPAFKQSQVSWYSPSQGVVPPSDQAPPNGPGSGECPPIDPALEVEQPIVFEGNDWWDDGDDGEEWALYYQQPQL